MIVFGLGFFEVLVILFIALVIYGPERLPKIAKQIAVVIKRFRLFADELKNSLRTEFQNMEKMAQIEEENKPNKDNE